MKQLKIFLVTLLILSFYRYDVNGQANASLNILTLNSGQVNEGNLVDLQVTVGATTGTGGQTGPVPVNKVRAQISIPIAIATAAPNAQQTGLPSGWIILTNTGATITVCNGTDIIPVGEQRQILIKIQGTAVGGPSTIAGSLSFGPGTGVCTGPGSLAGDNPADNTSTTSIEVLPPVVPLTLTDFYSELKNCQPVLRWVTATETNTSRFEIERGNAGNSDWTYIGTVQARGNSNDRVDYNFMDADLTGSSKIFLYRLKMIDLDGKYKYSGIVRTSVDCKTAIVHVYPNPVHRGDKLNVSITGASGYADVVLLSLTGQVVLNDRLSNGTHQLNISNIADGVYLLKVKSGSGINESIKVFVRH